MTDPTISVAVCTCDGAGHVARQLQSVLEQSVVPDQIVVCDDASGDATVDIVTQALRSAPCEVTVDSNRSRLGVAANFGRAIALAEGDVVVLSDQDDVWERRKLEVLTSTLASDPSLAAVFSDAALVDADLRPLGRTLWEALRFHRREQAMFDADRGVEVLLRRNVVAGATLAFPSRLRDVVLPMPPAGLHDAWIALLAAAIGRVAAVPVPLVRYRVHPANVVGVSNGLRAELARRRRATGGRAEEIAQLAAAADRLRDRAPSGAAGPWAEALDGKVELLRRRDSLPAGALARLPEVLPAVLSGHYRRYARGWRSGLYDLVGGGPGPGPAHGYGGG